ncbi:MAG: twin-arginine translocase TatA/TatE family subunit [Deltaproteobacteria bacterium]|nr:twin-arginine translocase TatA/TatE family subunit [Deltaproteobacteria bacterium]
MFSGIFSPMHLIVILVIVLIIFGPGKLPELGNSLGKSIKNFKKAMDDPDGKLEAEAELKKKLEAEAETKKIDESK